MLNDQRFDAPVIHVVSESPRLEMLQTRLRQAGLRPVPVRGSYLPPDSAPAMIDNLTRRNNLQGLDNRLIVTIGKQGLSTLHSDIHLSDVAQIESLPARLAIRQRETQRQREIQLRARTAEKFGTPATASAPIGKARILWLGQDAPFLNAIKSSLAEAQVTLVAAISRLTAEDYLTSGQFQTLVLCPATPNDEAARLLSRVKSLQIVTQPRVVLLLRPELAGQISSDDMSNADQILDLTADLESVANNLHAVSHEALVVRDTYAPSLTVIEDPATGLVSREYLESHLEAQMEQSDRLATPLSVVAFTLSAQDDIRAVATTIKSLLRDTDLAARLDSTHICVTLPETAYRGAVVLSRRVEESLGTNLTWRVIERRRFHTLKTLLGGLTAKSPFTRQRTAS
jgi:PleD family two-component response regulator